MVRLFIAALLPEIMKQALEDLIVDLKPRGEGIRWVAAKNMHLTLKFIGEVPEKQIEPIGRELETALEGRGRFEARIKACGGFPNLRNPRVLWAGLDGAEPAIEMAKVINKRLAKIGIEAERRPLSPHLTLGRIKKRTDLSALAAYMNGLTFETEPIILDRVALVKSTLAPGGPIYENLKLYELE